MTSLATNLLWFLTLVYCVSFTAQGRFNLTHFSQSPDNHTLKSIFISTDNRRTSRIFVFSDISKASRINYLDSIRY